MGFSHIMNTSHDAGIWWWCGRTAQTRRFLNGLFHAFMRLFFIDAARTSKIYNSVLLRITMHMYQILCICHCANQKLNHPIIPCRLSSLTQPAVMLAVDSHTCGEYPYVHTDRLGFLVRRNRARHQRRVASDTFCARHSECLSRGFWLLSEKCGLSRNRKETMAL